MQNPGLQTAISLQEKFIGIESRLQRKTQERGRETTTAVNVETSSFNQRNTRCSWFCGKPLHIFKVSPVKGSAIECYGCGAEGVRKPDCQPCEESASLMKETVTAATKYWLCSRFAYILNNQKRDPGPAGHYEEIFQSRLYFLHFNKKKKKNPIQGFTQCIKGVDQRGPLDSGASCSLTGQNCWNAQMYVGATLRPLSKNYIAVADERKVKILGLSWSKSDLGIKSKLHILLCNQR